jgi:hypothetical protein
VAVKGGNTLRSSCVVNLGVSISNRAAEPHCGTTQSGASRSVAPDRECKALRWWFARNKGSWSGYLSMKRDDGKVR